MAITEIEPRLSFGQRLATRIDRLLTNISDTKVQVADVPGTPGEFHTNSLARVELHRRFSGSGSPRKIIAHLIDKRDRVVTREVFTSEAELKQTWGKLLFRPQ